MKFLIANFQNNRDLVALNPRNKMDITITNNQYLNLTDCSFALCVIISFVIKNEERRKKNC